MADDDLRRLVEENPGQGSFEEYKYLRDLIHANAPCKLLIFSVGKDSRFWLEANAGGRTTFVEHEAEWIAMTQKQLPEAEIYQVKYETRLPQWKKLLDKPETLFMEDLPADVASESWDIIFVDSPQGGNRKRPGRMKSIYTASVLGRRTPSVHVLLHDCDRKVERIYGDTFLGLENLVDEVRTLRHYALASGDAAGSTGSKSSA